MRTKLIGLTLALPMFAISAMALAQNSPIGTWTTIDDKTHKPTSVVEIYETRDGTLSGRVNEILHSDHGPNPLCVKCSGANKDKPVKGMTILWGITKHGDNWDGGKILDPNNGKLYSVKLTPTDNGNKLEVRGFMGFSLLGRSQRWTRTN